MRSALFVIQKCNIVRCGVSGSTVALDEESFHFDDEEQTLSLRASKYSFLLFLNEGRHLLRCKESLACFVVVVGSPHQSTRCGV